jgi:hypothetical protein
MPEINLNSAIAALENRLAEHERKVSELRNAINLLCEEAGQPQKYLEVAAGGSGNSGGSSPMLTQIKRDSFYGKKQMTAVREYLEMRRAQGNGPATPREIYDAMKAGGYTFGTKSDHIALVTLRALLRKATTVFHKLPGTGTYGLSAWYPDAKTTKADGDDDAAPRKSSKTTGSRRGAKSKSKTKSKQSPAVDNKAPKQSAAADQTAAPEGR